MNLNNIDNFHNLIIGHYTGNKVVDKVLDDAYKNFRNQVSSVSKEFKNNAYSTFNSFFDSVSNLKLSHLYISITKSDSLFCRFSVVGNSYEFKFEAFYDYDANDETDIEAILHVYNNNEKENAYFGSISYLFDIITKLTSEYNLVYVFNCEASFIYKTVPIGIQNYSISEAANSFIPQQNYPRHRFQQTASLG